MSHFVCTVIGKNPEKQLFPFSESTDSLPRRMLEFKETENDSLRKYRTGFVEKVLMPDGRMLNKWDEEFRVQGSIGTGSDTHKVPENLPVEKIPYRKLYPTFDQYMKDWCGEEKRDPIKKRFGYWHNPKAKWDWYQLGGRWTGYFKLKTGVVGTTGTPGIMTEKAKAGYADQALKKNIDFDTVRREQEKLAIQRYDEIIALYGGKFPKLPFTWKQMAKKYKNIDKRREAYRAQTPLKLKGSFCSKLGSLTEIQKEFVTWGNYEDYACCSKEDFVRSWSYRQITPFAVIKNGKWHEKGDMGWWGLVSNEKDQVKWSDEFFKLLNKLPGNTLLSVYDCHI